MALYLDHIVLKVDDLSLAMENFQAAGFNVVRGGRHGGGLSENALILFRDDTFIELFSLTHGLKAGLFKLLVRLKLFKRFQYSKKWGIAYRFYSRSLELPDGLTDICFISDDYTSDCQRIHGEGLFLTRSLKASRRRTDGKRVRWEMSAPFINEMPFLRSAYNPVSQIDEESKTHENGVTGISKVLIAALDFKDTSSKYELFLGMKALSEDNKNGQKAIFKLKNNMVELIKSSENKTIQETMRGKGLGMYAVQFKSDKKVIDLSKIEQCGVVIAD